MKAFLDTNIPADILIERQDRSLSEGSAKAIAYCDRFRIALACGAITVSNLNYLLRKLTPGDRRKCILSALKGVTIVGASGKDVEKALKGIFPDIEDEIQYLSAISEGCDLILTRNKKDFLLSEIPVYTPEEFVEEIES